MEDQQDTLAPHDSDGDDNANRDAFRAYIGDVSRRGGKVGTPLPTKRASVAPDLSDSSHPGSGGSSQTGLVVLAAAEASSSSHPGSGGSSTRGPHVSPGIMSVAQQRITAYVGQTRSMLDDEEFYTFRTF